MSITSPVKADVVSGMRSVANMLEAKAAELKAFAEGLSETSEEEFMAHLGGRYSGPSYLRQMQEAVAKASEIRPSDTFFFQHAATEVFGKAQRETAVEAAAQEAV